MLPNLPVMLVLDGKIAYKYGLCNGCIGVGEGCGAGDGVGEGCGVGGVKDPNPVWVVI